MLALMERCQNTQCIEAWFVWGCVAADWSECPCWPLSIDESTYRNGHVSVKTGPSSNGRRWPGLMNRFFLHYVDGRVCTCCLPGEAMAPECIMGRWQVGRASVMLWAMFCWQTLNPSIHVHVTLTHATYLNIVADQVHPFMATVFPDGTGLFQQDNVPCHTVKIVQEWF